jgi:lipopolysaccharide export LptBFGC system permease protein LptF
MYPVSVTYTSAVIAGVLAAAVLAVWPWARQRGRFAVAGVATLVGWIAWHLLLNATRATGFDVDAPVIRVSWEDVGSGVVTLFLIALIFGLVTERREAAVRVVGAASIAGLVALILDVFV